MVRFQSIAARQTWRSGKFTLFLDSLTATIIVSLLLTLIFTQGALGSLCDPCSSGDCSNFEIGAGDSHTFYSGSCNNYPGTVIRVNYIGFDSQTGHDGEEFKVYVKKTSQSTTYYSWYSASATTLQCMEISSSSSSSISRTYVDSSDNLDINQQSGSNFNVLQAETIAVDIHCTHYFWNCDLRGKVSFSCVSTGGSGGGGGSGTPPTPTPTPTPSATPTPTATPVPTLSDQVGKVVWLLTETSGCDSASQMRDGGSVSCSSLCAESGYTVTSSGGSTIALAPRVAQIETGFVSCSCYSGTATISGSQGTGSFSDGSAVSVRLSSLPDESGDEIGAACQGVKVIVTTDGVTCSGYYAIEEGTVLGQTAVEGCGKGLGNRVSTLVHAGSDDPLCSSEGNPSSCDARCSEKGYLITMFGNRMGLASRGPVSGCTCYAGVGSVTYSSGGNAMSTVQLSDGTVLTTDECMGTHVVVSGTFNGYTCEARYTVQSGTFMQCSAAAPRGGGVVSLSVMSTTILFSIATFLGTYF